MPSFLDLFWWRLQRTAKLFRCCVYQLIETPLCTCAGNLPGCPDQRLAGVKMLCKLDIWADTIWLEYYYLLFNLPHLAFDACTRMLTPNSFRCLTSKDNVNLKSKHTHTLTIYNNLRPHVLGGIFTLFENEFRSLICFGFFFFKHYIPHQLNTKLVLLWL